MAVRTPRIVSVCFAALLAAGCSSDDPDPEDGVEDDGADGADGADGGEDDGGDNTGGGTGGDGTWTVAWGPITVEPGEEDTRCIKKRLPTDAPVRIGQIVNELGDASHHMIVYRLAGDEEEVLEPEPCQPFVDVLDPSQGAPLAVTQKADEIIQLPAGVAFSLEAEQMIRIELHFVNASDEPIELSASSTFVEVPDDEFEHEADFLFVGNPDISIEPTEDPPNDVATTLPTPFLPLPPELAGINIFAVTGHEHQWGTGVSASITTGEEDEGTVIYAPEDFQWDEPETFYHDPPMTMPEGGGFRFSCSWKNFSDETVGFGESVDDEMCFFWAYYYPSQGAQICFHTDQLGGNDLCCPDNPLCEYIDDWLNMQ